MDFEVTSKAGWQDVLAVFASMTQERLQDEVLLEYFIQAVLDELRFEVVQALNELCNLTVNGDKFRRK